MPGRARRREKCIGSLALESGRKSSLGRSLFSFPEIRFLLADRPSVEGIGNGQRATVRTFGRIQNGLPVRFQGPTNGPEATSPRGDRVFSALQFPRGCFPCKRNPTGKRREREIG
ncbi:hypothetical protein V0288_15390 [Pannus brasiliensis CCIBt3594]|uniref:Uncharacterized protein n=1 Tax=Pannus brasiliensis CCIBt3594 TaxID=1427578 RepID=A0AAW9QTX1_9CHRO